MERISPGGARMHYVVFSSKIHDIRVQLCRLSATGPQKEGGEVRAGAYLLRQIPVAPAAASDAALQTRTSNAAGCRVIFAAPLDCPARVKRVCGRNWEGSPRCVARARAEMIGMASRWGKGSHLVQPTPSVQCTALAVVAQLG